MKKLMFILIVLSFCLNQTEGRNLNAFFSYCTFDQPGKSPYIETYLNVAGNSVKRSLNAEKKFQGKIEVQWVYKQNDKIVHFDKYNLLSPAVSDSSTTISDFIDQQRVPLANGEYVLELKITDKNSADQSYVSSQNISINYSSAKVNVSDIEFLESYTPTAKAGTFSKSGYNVVPLVYNYFPKTSDTLKFYAEIYNTKEILGNQDFLVSYSISGHQNNHVVNNLAGNKKQKSSSVNILMAELPIKEVTSGNYNLAIEVRNKSNELLATKQTFFQRSNPVERQLSIDDLSLIKIDNTFVSYITNADTLKDYISCLYPISSQVEDNVEQNQILANNLASMQQFFYYFWSKRNADDPELAWLNYKAEVDKVNASYKSLNKKGYETDRGRVYLQYGPPNEIFKRYSEPFTFPYEIWHYNTIANQRDGKFVFYSHNMSSNDFQLLHSNVNGEFYNANWTSYLDDSPPTLLHKDVDQNGTNRQDRIDSPGARAKEEFDHPK